jgi:hypothetical protein
MHVRYPRLVTLAMALVVLSLDGCGPPGKPMGRLAGTITYRGNPVTEGEVEVMSDDIGVGAAVLLDGSGRFVLEDPVPVGVYNVSVAPPRFLDPTREPPKGKAYASIPKKARNAKTSGLTVQVNPGKNDVVIELQD